MLVNIKLPWFCLGRWLACFLRTGDAGGDTMQMFPTESLKLHAVGKSLFKMCTVQLVVLLRGS